MARHTFIRVIAYWLPSADGSLLEFGGGLFGSAVAEALRSGQPGLAHQSIAIPLAAPGWSGSVMRLSF